MALLKNLIAEARNKNRKKARSRTNHTYYKRTRVVIDAHGTDTQIDEFLQGVTSLMDRDVQIEVL